VEGRAENRKKLSSILSFASPAVGLEFVLFYWRILKMPNWCENDLEIVGPLAEVRDLFEKIKNQNELLNVLRRNPSGHSLSWRFHHWGTKWEVDPSELEFSEFGGDSGILYGRFESAWGPPVEAFVYFGENNPNLTINLYYNEPLLGFAGEISISAGIVSVNRCVSYAECNPDEIRNCVGEDLDNVFLISYQSEV
jgi:hypothetical protein